MTINSLWLWGPGQLPAAVDKRYSRVFSGHPLARGLARVSGTPCDPPPAAWGEVESALGKAGPTDAAVLVVVEDLLQAVQYEDADAWRNSIRKLEADWFVPLSAAIRGGRVALDLRASTIYGLIDWQVARGDLWRFWQRPASIGAIAHRLAGGRDGNAP